MRVVRPCPPCGGIGVIEGRFNNATYHVRCSYCNGTGNFVEDGREAEVYPYEEVEQELFFNYVDGQMEGAAQAQGVEVQHAHSPYHMVYAVPNGGFRSKKTAAMLERTGLRPGVFDVMVDVPWYGVVKEEGMFKTVASFHGLRIEMKRRGKFQVSAAQRTWEARWRGYNYLPRICSGHLVAIEVLEGYLAGKLKEQGGEL